MDSEAQSSMSSLDHSYHASFLSLPTELLCEIRSCVPDILTHVSLSQTCTHLRNLYAADPAKRVPCFFETILPILGIGKSTHRPDGKEGDIPSWNALAAAVAHHSSHCELEVCRTILKKDLCKLPIPRIIDSDTAAQESTVIKFHDAVDDLHVDMICFDSVGKAQYPADFGIRVTGNFLGYPEDTDYLVKHVTAASLFATEPPIASLLIIVDDDYISGLDVHATKANETGVTCFDAMEGLCDMLNAPFEFESLKQSPTMKQYLQECGCQWQSGTESDKESGPEWEEYEGSDLEMDDASQASKRGGPDLPKENGAALGGEEATRCARIEQVPKRFDGVEKLYEAFEHRARFEGFRQTRCGKLAAEVCFGT